MWFLYECLLTFGLLVYLPKALWRKRLPHRGWTMRLGRYPEDVRRRLAPAGGAIWVHAVSVGEVLAVQPLVRALLESHPAAPLVLSTITPTGFEVASKLLGSTVVTIFEPLDFRATVTRALDLIQPRLLILVESELWPTLIRLTKQRGARVVIVNGRISERACRRYLLVKSWMRRLLESIDLSLMQTEADAERLITIGAPVSRVKVLGSLKWDASLLARPSRADVEALAQQVGVNHDETLLVAGSTHQGEEIALFEAFDAIRAVLPSAKLVIAPRHPERIGEVEGLAHARAVRVIRISQMRKDAAWDIALVDTMGQLPRYYGLATVAFVGGSLIPHGGQNPIEPASLGKPVVFGPSMHNFADITQQLLAHQAARQLRDRAELTPALQELLTNREEASLMGARAQALVERLGGTTQRTLHALSGLLT